MTHAGGPDCTTPLLMQFLLLPLDDGARAGGILSRFLHGREPIVEGTPELPLALGTNELQDAQEAQALARRVLTAVAENLPIRTRDLAEIEGAAQRFDRRLGYTHAHITVTDVSGELALLTEAVLPQTVFLAHDGLPVQRLLADVFRELKYALGAHLTFRVCGVCGVLHRDNRYTPHICLGPAALRPTQTEEASHLASPLPRTPADEPGAEIPEEETIYGVVTDPIPSGMAEMEPTPTGLAAFAEPSAHGHGRFERHAAPNGIHYSQPQPSPESSSPTPKQRSRPEGSSAAGSRSTRAAKEEQSASSASHPGAAYWKDQQTS